MSHFKKSTLLHQRPAEVYQWHARPGAFARLTPPWEDVRVTEGGGGPIHDGLRVVLTNRLGPLRLRWVANHTDVVEGRGFTDVMESGPFSSWRHEHRFEDADSGCRLVDDIEYRIPGGALGRVLGNRFIRRKLERMFAFRHRITEQDLIAHARGGVEMKVVLGGSTGMVGSALTAFLSTGGHEVVRLVRPKTRPTDGTCVAWDPARGEIAAGAVDGAHAVVHLGGVNLAGQRWTAGVKRQIRESRVASTRLLAETIARASPRPETFVCASAIGYYGDRGDTLLTEASDAGTGFLADVCRAWEDATQPARDAGVRVVTMRIGIVLSPAGGALGKLLPPFRLGLGGRLGDGTQYMSWISLEDMVGAIHHALLDRTLEGPVNGTAPHPVTNAAFSKTLGRVLRRPAVLPLPRTAARLLLGKDQTDEMLLVGARVLPAKLAQAGYTFRHPTLEEAFRSLLGK